MKISRYCKGWPDILKQDYEINITNSLNVFALILLKVKGRHRWTIDNFLRRASCTEVGDSLCSPVFSVPVEAFAGEVQDLAFQLEVFPNGEEGEDNR